MRLLRVCQLRSCLSLHWGLGSPCSGLNIRFFAIATVCKNHELCTFFLTRILQGLLCAYYMCEMRGLNGSIWIRPREHGWAIP